MMLDGLMDARRTAGKASRRGRDGAQHGRYCMYPGCRQRAVPNWLIRMLLLVGRWIQVWPPIGFAAHRSRKLASVGRRVDSIPRPPWRPTEYRRS